MVESVASRPLQIDLNAPVTWRDIPALAGRFLTWWLGELSALMPARLHSLFPRPDMPALLQVSDADWRLHGPTDGTQPILLDLHGDDKSVAEQLLSAAPSFSLSNLVVLLPQKSVLRRSMELPMMPDRLVRSAVELQIDRLSPFKSDSVRYDVRVASRDAVDGKLVADIVIVPRNVLEALEQRLAGVGLKARTIDVDSGGGVQLGFNLLTVPTHVNAHRSLPMQAGLAGAAVAAWIVCGMMWENSRAWEIEQLQVQVRDLKPAAERSARFRAQVEAMAQPLELAAHHDPSFLLTAIKELTVVLPDNAQLTEFAFSEGEFSMSGVAVNAPQLIKLLESSPRFSSVKFRSPVMSRPDIGKDRFEILARAEGWAKQ